MNKILILSLVLIGMIFSCSKESEIDNVEEEEVVVEIDSFKHLTPCLAEIVTDFSNYVLNDTFPLNDDFDIEQVVSMEIGSVTYFWLKTDWIDETEYVLTEECNIFCRYNGWTGFDDACFSEFQDSTWTMAWQK